MLLSALSILASICFFVWYCNVPTDETKTVYFMPAAVASREFLQALGWVPFVAGICCWVWGCWRFHRYSYGYTTESYNKERSLLGVAVGLNLLNLGFYVCAAFDLWPGLS
jgi:hypothetical protein